MRIIKTIAELNAILAREVTAMDGVCSQAKATAVRCVTEPHTGSNWLVKVADGVCHEDCCIALHHFGEQLRLKYNVEVLQGT